MSEGQYTMINFTFTYFPPNEMATNFKNGIEHGIVENKNDYIG